MTNKYLVKLINLEGCKFDEEEFTNMKVARKWASERTGNYKVIIQKNIDYQGMDGYAEATTEYTVNHK